MARSANVVVNITGDARDMLRAFAEAERASSSFGQKVNRDLQILGHWAKRGAQMIGAIGAAVVGIAVKGGIDRLMGLERANKQLQQLGVVGEQADGLMDALLTTLRGTPFALDAGAASLAGFVASGRDLADVPRLVQQVTDAAAFGNTTLEDMDFIWQRVQTTGRITNRELQMLAERNIPVYQQLAGAMGMTAQEVRDLAATGKLSADQFFDAWEAAADGTIDGTVRIAGAAKAMGDTTEGAWANMRTAMSRFGATLLEDVFPLAKDVFNAIGEGFDRMGEVFKQAMDIDTSGFESFVERIPDMMESAAEAVVTLWQETEGLRKLFQTGFAGAVGIAQNRLVQLGVAGVAAYKLITLTAGHPLLAGLALLALAIGATEMRTREAEAAGKDLASRWAEMTVLARELALVELFSASQVAVLEAAGVTLNDLATGETSWAEAKRLVNDEITNFLGLTAPMDMAGKGALETLEGLEAGEKRHREELERKQAVYADELDALMAKERAERDAAEATDDHTDAQKANTQATEEDIAAKKAQQQALMDLHNPIGRLITLAEEQKEAQRELNEAVDTYGENSDEAMAAALKLAGVNSDMIGIMQKLREDGIEPTGLEARNMFRDLGIPEETINAIFGSFNRIANNLPVLNFQANIPSFAFEQSGNRAVPRGTGNVRLGGVTHGATGGIIDDEMIGHFGEGGKREALIPLETQQGKKALADALAEAMRGNGSGSGVHFHGPVYGLDDFERKLQEVIVRARRRGLNI